MSSSIAEHIAKSPKRLNGIVVARIATCANPPVPVSATADTVIHAKPFFRFSDCAMTPHESDRSSGGPRQSRQVPTAHVHPNRRPSRSSAHWGLLSNALIPFLQSDRSSPVGKQQQQIRSSTFSHDSAIHRAQRLALLRLGGGDRLFHSTSFVKLRRRGLHGQAVGLALVRRR